MAWRSLAVSADGARAACGADSWVDLVDADDGSLEDRLPLEHGARVTRLAWSPDGRWLAVGTRAGALMVWAVDGVATLVLRHREHGERVSALTFTPDGRQLLSGSWDATVRTLQLDAIDAPLQVLDADFLRRWGGPPSGFLP